jgi:hypothetical protein
LSRALEMRRELESVMKGRGSEEKRKEKARELCNNFFERSRIIRLDVVDKAHRSLELLKWTIRGHLPLTQKSLSEYQMLAIVGDLRPEVSKRRLRRSTREDRGIQRPAVSIEDIAKALNEITWPTCDTRQNVIPDGMDSVKAFPLGLIRSRSISNPQCSKNTTEWPRLSWLLTDFMRQQYPDFQYTSIQLNKDYAAKLHIDGHNNGLSCALAHGDYDGGELWIFDPDGDYEVEVTEKIPRTTYKIGTKLKGKRYNINGQLLFFDGCKPHMVLPFTGHRTSIVFYTAKGYEKTPKSEVEKIKAVGFDFPALPRK